MNTLVASAVFSVTDSEDPKGRLLRITGSLISGIVRYTKLIGLSNGRRMVRACVRSDNARAYTCTNHATADLSYLHSSNVSTCQGI